MKAGTLQMYIIKSLSLQRKVSSVCENVMRYRSGIFYSRLFPPKKKLIYSLFS